jgi:nitrogen regulatory protein PII
MRAVKRVELVIDAVELPQVLRIVKSLGIGGWTLVRDVAGQGDRGSRMGDQPTDVMRNVVLIIACDYEQSKRLAEAIRPILARMGGMCLISDATWVVH